MMIWVDRKTDIWDLKVRDKISEIPYLRRG